MEEKTEITTPANNTAAASEETKAQDNATSTEKTQGTLAEQKQQDAKKQDPGIFGGSWFLLALMGLVWIWFLRSSRKYKKEQKERKDKIESVKKGDKIVTIGRMHGTVVSVDAETVTVKTDAKGNCTITFDRNAIFQINPKKEKEGEGEGQES